MVVVSDRRRVVDKLHPSSLEAHAEFNVFPAIFVEILVETTGLQKETPRKRQIRSVEKVKRYIFPIFD